MASELLRDSDAVSALRNARVIAVLGANPRVGRPAQYVPEYLHQQGYRVIPVNSVHAGDTLWGERVRATLAEIAEPVDIVDVFRRAEIIPEHLDDILAMQPRPALVWFQLGIRNDDIARRLVEAGIDVVQDRCTLADHRRHGIPRVPSR